MLEGEVPSESPPPTSLPTRAGCARSSPAAGASGRSARRTCMGLVGVRELRRGCRQEAGASRGPRARGRGQPPGEDAASAQHGDHAGHGAGTSLTELIRGCPRPAAALLPRVRSGRPWHSRDVSVRGSQSQSSGAGFCTARCHLAGTIPGLGRRAERCVICHFHQIRAAAEPKRHRSGVCAHNGQPATVQAALCGPCGPRWGPRPQPKRATPERSRPRGVGPSWGHLQAQGRRGSHQAHPSEGRCGLGPACEATRQGAHWHPHPLCASQDTGASGMPPICPWALP